MAFIARARGREAARGLSAINAMHPECTCYNYFISRGQATIVTEFVNKEISSLATKTMKVACRLCCF